MPNGHKEELKGWETVPKGWVAVPGRPSGWYAPPESVGLFAKEEKPPPKTEIPGWGSEYIGPWLKSVGQRFLEEFTGGPKYEYNRATGQWQIANLPPDLMAPEIALGTAWPSARGMYQPWQRDVPIKREGLTPAEQWQLQAREWELGQYGYVIDPETGMPRRPSPWEQLPTTLQAPPEGLRLPPEWGEWYGGLTAPEYHPKGNVEYYSERFRDVPQVALPENYPMLTDVEKLSWLSANAYETVYADQAGNIIDRAEVMRRAMLNPNEPIREMFLMGGGEVIDDEFPAGEVEYREQVRPSPTALERRGEVIGGKWFGVPTTERGGEALLVARENEAVRQALGTSLVKSVLESGYTYEQKLETITDLYSQFTGKALSQRGYLDIKNAVQTSLSPEDLEALRAKGEKKPPAVAAEKKEAVDVATLTESLAPYGVNLTANYPFISPITEAHLMRIPSEVLEQMARYLEEKGISWQDFLAISGGWYGGGAPARGRWEIPRQWS